MKKIKILLATRKHRFDMKAINEICLPENYPIEIWEQFISQKSSRVAFTDGKIVGYCVLYNNLIASIAVLPEYRNMHIASMLLDKVIDSVTSSSIALHVRISNEVALKLYKSRGFEIDTTISEYYEDKEDAFFMKKKIICI